MSMSIDKIKVRGARTHNLKNIDIDLELNKITCIYGPSGSGKTSLAFHTLFTESKRRFINSLPTDVKFFWEIPNTIDVDSIYPVLPVWGLKQSNPIVHSRPSCLDVIGLSDDIQKIFFYGNEKFCPEHFVEYEEMQSHSTLADELKSLELNSFENEIFHVFISAADFSGSISPVRSLVFKKKCVKEYQEGDEFVEIFRVKAKDLDKLGNKINESLVGNKFTEFFVLALENKKIIQHKLRKMRWCPVCHHKNQERSLLEYSPHNSLGACSECGGHGMKLVFDKKKMVKDDRLSLKEGALGIVRFARFSHLESTFLKECSKNGIDINVPFNKLSDDVWEYFYKGSGKFPGIQSYFNYLERKKYKKNIRIYTRGLQSEIICPLCQGTKVSVEVASLKLGAIKLGDFLLDHFSHSRELLAQLKRTIENTPLEKQVSSNLDKCLRTLSVAIEMGLGHIQNSRKVRSLSANEYQRLLLVKYVSYQGSGSMFVLDEPSLGLTIKQQEILFRLIRELCNQGNTILLVDHSVYMRSKSDQVIQMGPGTGDLGGKVVYQGPYKETEESLVFKRRAIDKIEKIKVENICIRQLKGKFEFAKNAITLFKGESGTGKSSFVVDAFANEMHKKTHGTLIGYEPFELEISQKLSFQNVIVGNKAIEKISSRSNVGTYTGLGVFVRKYFANLQVSKDLGLKDGHFSANSELGQCTSCLGKGVKIVEMHFLEDIEFTCEECKGKKLKPFVANISDGIVTVFDAFHLPVKTVFQSVKVTPKGKRILDYMHLLKIDYLNLDRSLDSLSGGEKQRIYLLTLLEQQLENSLLIFENISAGLSARELSPLLELLHQLTANNNTIFLIDQNPLLENACHFTYKF